VQNTVGCQYVCHITSANKPTDEFLRSSLCYDSSDGKMSIKRPFCEESLSDCHSFIIILYILFSFKYKTNKPTVISVEQNKGKRKVKFNYCENTQSKLILFSIKQIKSPPFIVPTFRHLTPCTLTISNLHLTNFLLSVVTSFLLYVLTANVPLPKIKHPFPLLSWNDGISQFEGNCEWFVKL
jgi:hypothetical protein